MSTFGMGRVALVVNDLDRVSDWYQQAVGLHLLSRDGGVARLGAGDATLLELRQDKAARRSSPQEAGLFHTAFLLPQRADLAQWTADAIQRQTPVAGASDHLVSEAVYLTDPEGNGVEIYADRPQPGWAWQGGQVAMDTIALDVGNLLAAGQGGSWQGAPAGTTVGHVHLQVGAIPAAEGFYAGLLGLDVTAHVVNTARFYAANGYHHHIATNIWNSRGAGERAQPSTGLAEMEIRLSPDRLESIRSRAGAASGPLVLQDPWGTRLALIPA